MAQIITSSWKKVEVVGYIVIEQDITDISNNRITAIEQDITDLSDNRIIAIEDFITDTWKKNYNLATNKYCKCLPVHHKVGTQPYTDVPICSTCAAGLYWVEEQCVSCPEYSSTAAPGVLSVAECACVPGYFMQEEKCKPCPIDTFQSTLGGACTVCPLNAISAPGSDSQTDWVTVGPEARL